KLPAEDSRRSTALTELQAALQARADYGPAVQLLSDIPVEVGQHAEAGRGLLRAPQAPTQSASRSETILLRSYSEEAARLLARAGQPIEAARVIVRELGGGAAAGAPTLLPALRWQLAALTPELVGKADQVLSEQVAEVLGAEAEQTPYKHRTAAL